MDDKYRTNIRTPSNKPNFNSRQSLFDMVSRNSMRPSDVGMGRFSLGGGNLLASTAKKSLNLQNNGVKHNRDPRGAYEVNKASLRNFLQDNDAPFDMKVVGEPSKKNFEGLFLFIYVQLDPDFQSKNLATDCPKILSMLGYPLKLKPSTMQAISAIHSWPYVIDALAWLADFSKGFDSIELTNLLTYGEQEETIRRAYAYNYFTTCYKKQALKPAEAANPNFFEEEKNSFKNQLIQNDDEFFNKDELLEEKATLQHELKELKLACKEVECQELKEECEAFQVDILALNDYVKKAESFVSEIEKKRNELSEAMAHRQDALRVLKSENNSRKVQIQNQVMSAQEARQKTTLLSSLRENLTALRKDLSKWQDEPLKLQGHVFKVMNNLRDRITQISEDMSKIVQVYFTKSECQQNGFFILGENRAMDLEAADDRVEKMEEILKLLLEKMDAFTENLRQQTAHLKDQASVCDKMVEGIHSRRMKVDQEVAVQRKNIELNIEDCERESRKLNVEEKILKNKRDSEVEVKKRLDGEVLVLTEKAGELQMTYESKLRAYKIDIGNAVSDGVDQLNDYYDNDEVSVDKLDERAADSTAAFDEYMRVLKTAKEMDVDDSSTR